MLCVGNSSVVKVYIIYDPNWDQLRKMQLQGLPTGKLELNISFSSPLQVLH